jgi:hypothetical protein
MDRRRSPRVEVQLPVEVWGLDAHGQAFMDPALVTDMSSSGLVLQGLRRKIRAGEILDVRMGDDKAQYRVIWIGGTNTGRAGELGMQRITADPFFPLNSVLTCCAQAAGSC